ncbi:MAG TPA: iron-siderophore ABC transporter substrate-binding protein [Segeticoccus sp.]|nr:iron-siderophore ABC transporter substrate-binding protein [Segeticoccus sp.]
MRSTMHPTRHRPSRPRGGLLAAVTVAAALVLAGCGGSSAATGEDRGSGGAAAGSSGGDAQRAGHFPVTIDSALGEATISEPPERVVTLGQGSTGTAIAMGHVPVGIEKYPWGSDQSGYLPWVHQAVEEAGAKLPQQFTGGTELDIEAVAALEPDVILAPWSGITQQQYDLLSQIAPTVAYPDKPWSTQWAEQIRIIGTALGEPTEAREEIAEIKDRFAQVREQNPGFAKHTFAYTYTNGPGTFGVYLKGEQRVEMLRKMGLELAPAVAKMPAQNGNWYAELGLENVDTVKDADLLFTWYMDGKSRRQLMKQPLYAGIPAIERGSVVAAKDHPFVTASSMINPLTVPWSIDRYVPMIHEAIDHVER